MKRTLSTFMALTCLFCCPVSINTVLASEESLTVEEFSYTAPGPLKPKPHVRRICLNAAKKVNIARQKAFLTALLCMIGCKVNIKFDTARKISTKFKDFLLTKIDNSNISYQDNTDILPTLINILENRKDLIDFEVNSTSSQYITNYVKINGRVIKIEKIIEYGEEILESISQENFVEEIKSSQEDSTENLSSSPSFKVITNDIYQKIISQNDNSHFKDFQILYSPYSRYHTNTNKKSYTALRESRNNAIHQKAFLTALLYLANAEIYIDYNQNGRNKSYDFLIWQVDSQPIPAGHSYKEYAQINALLTELQSRKDKIDYKLEFDPIRNKITSAEVAGCKLNDSMIDSIGEEITDLLYSRKTELKNSIFLNRLSRLDSDTKFADGCIEILETAINKDAPTYSHIAKPQAQSYDSETKRKIAIQKAFITSLICSMGIDVYAKFEKDDSGKINDFTITKIDALNIEPNLEKQLQTLLFMLSNQQSITNFKCNMIGNDIKYALFGNLTFSEEKINDLGTTVLNAICESEQEHIARFPNKKESVKNLTTDLFLTKPSFQNILYTILNSNLINIKSVEYGNFEKNIKKFHKLLRNYQKAFLIGLASMTNVDTVIMTPETPFAHKVHNTNINSMGGKFFLELSKIVNNITPIVAEFINHLFPPEILRISVMQSNYNIIENVKIKNLTLDIEDTLQLGREFYDLINEEENKAREDETKKLSTSNSISKTIKNKYFFLQLNTSKCFVDNLKTAFQNQTGVEFPSFNA